MNLKIEGVCFCDHCNKEFEWYYIVPQSIEDRLYNVNILPKNKQSLQTVIKKGNGKWDVSVRCSCCDRLIFFSIKEYTNEKV